ncbi:MAG: ATP-grasp domain-containing protein, partial [Bacteroidetes bacterium]
AEQLAVRTIEAYGLCGLLAVELFLTKSGELLVNEVAPRPHNSGHHTIDSCYTSQFEQHLRAILNLPLGSTEMKTASVMVNLLGEEGHSGPVAYEGMEQCLSMKGVNVHLYGKKETRPFRKMGHVTVVADSVAAAFDIARRVKETLKVVSRGVEFRV